MTSIYSTYFSQFEFNNQNIIHQNSLQTDPQNPIPFSSMNSSFVQSVKLVTPYFSHYASDYPVLVQRIPESPITRFWNSHEWSNNFYTSKESKGLSVVMR